MLKKIEAYEFEAGGDVFVDVGANIGMWTAELYPLYKQIYFIEPSSHAMNEAKNNIKDTDNKIVYLKKICSSVSNETKSIYSPFEHSGCLSVYGKELYEESHGISMSEENIETMTLDNLCNLFPQDSKVLLKVDTEGHDLDVLLGAEKFIEMYKPDIALEVHFHMYYDKTKYDKVFDFLKNIGYNIQEFKSAGYSGTGLVDGKHTGNQMRDLHYQMFMRVL